MFILHQFLTKSMDQIKVTMTPLEHQVLCNHILQMPPIGIIMNNNKILSKSMTSRLKNIKKIKKVKQLPILMKK